MVETTVEGGVTNIKEDGFTLIIINDGKKCGVPDGYMYAQHPCDGASGDDPFDYRNAALLFNEVLDEHCMDCGDINLPDDLKAIWYLYNFDRIQRNER